MLKKRIITSHSWLRIKTQGFWNNFVTRFTNSEIFRKKKLVYKTSECFRDFLLHFISKWKLHNFSEKCLINFDNLNLQSIVTFATMVTFTLGNSSELSTLMIDKQDGMTLEKFHCLVYQQQLVWELQILISFFWITLVTHKKRHAFKRTVLLKHAIVSAKSNEAYHLQRYTFKFKAMSAIRRARNFDM